MDLKFHLWKYIQTEYYLKTKKERLGHMLEEFKEEKNGKNILN